MSSSALPSFRFDAAALPVAEQFEAWRQALGITHEAILPDRDPRSGFAASSEVWRVGQTVLTDSRFDPLHFARPAARARRDGIDHYTLLLGRSGGWAGEVGGTTLAVGPDQVCMLDLARPMESQTSATESLCMLIPRDLLDARLPPGARHGMVLRDGAGALLADYLRALARRLPTLALGDAGAVEHATLGVIAACLAPSADRAAAAAMEFDTTRLAAARRVVAAELENPALAPDWLAARLGLSRTTLYRLFAPLGGVAGYIQDRRLDRVRALLGDAASRRRISDLAFACGFASEAHFSRLFRARFGVTARDWRAAVRGGPSAQAAGEHGRLYHAWVSGA